MTAEIQNQRRVIGKRAGGEQRRALMPDASVWVSASAGTGKTYVLTRRVLQLLVSGSVRHAGEVLALTYTRAAASEMQNRLREELMKWAVMPQDELHNVLTELTGTAPDGAALRRARSLFVEVLDTPGGLNMSTIHSFCQSLLARFPVEADIPPGFTLLEDRAQEELVWEAVNQTIDLAVADTGALRQGFELLADSMAETSLRQIFLSFIETRGRFRKLMHTYNGDLEALLSALAFALGLEEKPKNAYAEKAFVVDAVAPNPARDATLAGIAQALGQGGKTAQKAAATLASYLAASPEGRYALWSDYIQVFLKADFEPRKAVSDKPAKEAYGDGLEEACQEEGQRLIGVLDRINSVQTYLLTEAYLRMGFAIIDIYETQKSRRCALDFDDLISHTVKLLTTDPGQAAWVRYKMDTRISHVLLDEAQDTDNDQWGILKALMDDFFTGSGTHDAPRTYFAVGDMKQSIYRFRGAQPEVFQNMLAYLNTHAKAVGHKVEPVSLDTSFRSGEAVLGLVDRVFASPNRRAAVDDMIETLEHHAYKVGAGGTVEVWIPQKADKESQANKDLPPWPMPLREEQKQTASSAFYNNIAKTILQMVNDPNPLGTTGRPVQFGDIMILLRSRTPMGELIAALNTHNIRHTGADEVELTEDPVVLDLLALGRFLANSSDDLSLAHALRSPLFGLTDDALYGLSCRRVAGGSLWSVLYDCTDTPYADCAHTLKALLERADMDAPHGLFVAALTLTEGRSRMVGRYGRADDAASWDAVGESIDAFLDQTLAYVRAHPPSLTGFLHWFDTGKMKIKKEVAGGDAVRIMTAHKSKGLQAPVVILPETTKAFYKNTSAEKLVWRQHNGADDLFIYGVARGKAPKLLTELREAERAEVFKDEMRLLYVALTRAQDRLILAGVHTNAIGSDKEDCWYNHIVDAIEGEVSAGWQKEEDMWRYTLPVLLTEMPENVQVAALQDEAAHVRDWVFTPAVPEAPTESVQAAANDTETADKVMELLNKTGADTYRRGLLIHRMLEVLPRYPAHERPDRAHMFLATTAPDWDADTRNRAIADVMEVFDQYPELFDAYARAEVDIVARTENGVEGLRADCLVVRPDGVLVVDYKTNVRVPKVVPATYVKQLATYYAAVQRIWPDKPVKTAILWTAATPPRLDWVEV